ncbi:helix-turn-helix transcriptional regulator [Oscillospiraceae bacterium OttesenSCG-928-G22]|nr:helix-turn-helix transcriptional regulator [Oscillospiraceae bacterium OttesenSCG-928-G22]
MVGKKLRELRVRKGLTQRELGELTGVSASAIGMYEQGRRQPESELIVKFCRVFDVSADWFLTDLEERGPRRMEILTFVEQVKAQLYSQKGLLFEHVADEEPRLLDDEEIELLYEAILIGVEVARKINRQKYTPKKYR